MGIQSLPEGLFPWKPEAEGIQGSEGAANGLGCLEGESSLSFDARRALCFSKFLSSLSLKVWKEGRKRPGHTRDEARRGSLVL